MKREENNIDGFFKSEADKYVFILLHTDAANRMRLLGVTEASIITKHQLQDGTTISRGFLKMVTVNSLKLQWKSLITFTKV